MLRRIFLFCVVIAGVSGCSTQPLSGQWTPVSAQLGGKTLPVAAFNGGVLILADDSYDFAGDKGRITLLPDEKMDIQGVSGPNAGRTILAIYKLTGDKLSVCYQLGAGVRPQAFVSPAASKILLVNYNRAR